MSTDTKEADIQERFTKIVASSLRIEPDEIKPESTLDQDLGAESLDLIEITMEAESEFNICLPERSILETAREVFGPGVLDQDGVLTDAGIQMLRARMPVADVEQLTSKEKVTVNEITRYFMRVDTWTRMILDLAEKTPSKCPKCGSEDLEEQPGFQLKCAGCGESLSIPAGEDLNRAWVEEYYEKEYLPSAAGQSSGR